MAASVLPELATTSENTTIENGLLTVILAEQSPIETKLYLALRKHATTTGSCNCKLSLRDLVAALNVSHVTLIRALRGLQSKGYLTIEKNPNSGQPNTYRLASTMELLATKRTLDAAKRKKLLTTIYKVMLQRWLGALSQKERRDLISTWAHSPELQIAELRIHFDEQIWRPLLERLTDVEIVRLWEQLNCEDD